MNQNLIPIWIGVLMLMILLCIFSIGDLSEYYAIITGSGVLLYGLSKGVGK